MKNGYQPAFPIESDVNSGDSAARGLTKREYFAAMAMQGLLSNSHYVLKLEQNMEKKIVYDMNAMCAREAVDMADELLKQLENSKQ